MAVCLNYQEVYVRRSSAIVSSRLHLLAALFLLVSLAAKVWIKLESTDLGYQLARERQKTVELDMQRRELELQLSVLMRPDNLSRAAREKVGLVDSAPHQIIRLGS